MVNEADEVVNNGVTFGGGQQQSRGGGFGTFKNRPTTDQQKNGETNGNGQVDNGGSRPASALSQGAGSMHGGGTNQERNGHAGNGQNCSDSAKPNGDDNNSNAQPPTQSEAQAPRSGFSKRGGFGGKSTANQAEGADGTDFGDPPKRPAGTGANTAPLGVGRGSGFGKGRGAGTTGTGGGDGDPENDSGEQPTNDQRQTGFGSTGTAKMGGRGGGARGFGGRGGGTSGGGKDEEGGNSGTGFSRRGGGNNGFVGGNRGEGGGGGGGARTNWGGNGGENGERGAAHFGFNRRADGGFSDNRFSRPYETPDEMASQESYIPVDRTIKEIVEEDTRMAENYKTISEEDDECVVTGLPDGVPQQMLDCWEDAKFEEQLKTNIERSSYTRPRKIQSLTIPLIMDGLDIKGHAETGSGKSAAFLLPIINSIMKKKKAEEYKPERSSPYCLIIEPTRELCCQLYDQARKFAEGTGITVSKAFGKYKVKENAREISTVGCDILVGTPGRLLHFFEVKYLEAGKLKVLILDEADQLLEDDFARVLRQLPKVQGFPTVEDRQTLLFSATFAPEVQQWANDWLKKENVMVSNKKPVMANNRVIQKFMKVERSRKNNTLMEMLLKEEKEAAEENPANPAVKKTMVFVKMKRTADLVSTFLNCKQLKTTTINGDRPQKLRDEALNHFRTGKYNVVVTTDVCARGIDIKELDHVINLDLPIDHTTYVHRIGRTGRLKEGVATSFFDPNEDMELAKELVEGLKNAGQEIPDWLQDASDGKLQIEDPYTATNSWGTGGFGSVFGGGNKATTDEQQPARDETVENGGVEGEKKEDKKEPAAEENAGNADEAKVAADNGPTEEEKPAAQQPWSTTSNQQSEPAASDPNDDW